MLHYWEVATCLLTTFASSPFGGKCSNLRGLAHYLPTDPPKPLSVEGGRVGNTTRDTPQVHSYHERTN